MNRDYILNKIKPYLNEQGMLGEEDFNKLFHMLNNTQKYEVINILIESEIDIDYANVTYIKPKNSSRSENSSINISKLSNLTNEQLCVIYQQGNKPALEALISKNIKLIWSRVLKHGRKYNHKLDDEDLLQYGSIGLMKAAKRFDSTREAKFTTYAIWWIDQFILRGIVDHGFTVRLPVHYFELVSKVLGILSRNPDATKEEKLELVSAAGISEEKFEEVLVTINNIMSPTYLNTFVGEEDDSELGDFIVDNITPTVEEQVESNMLKEAIDTVLETLNRRERNIIELRFGLNDGIGKTLEQVGSRYDVTRERIRQIEAKALRKLRHPSRSKKLKDFL